MQVILNIGLDTNDGASLTIAEVVGQFAEPRDVINDLRIVESHTERTLVVDLRQLTSTTIHNLAVVLRQDAIAAWFPSRGKGELIGPGAEAWGEFNHTFFFHTDGRTLDEHVAEERLNAIARQTLARY